MRIERRSNIAFPDILMEEFSAFVVQRTGLYFPRERWPDLSRAMTAIMRDCGGSDSISDIRSLMSGALARSDAELLARHLSVGETYFFREPAIFNALEREILPELIAARRHVGRYLRIWSAGCCTGEELYSIAILLARMIPDLTDWKLTLLGTDINPQFLHKAKLGIYRDWSFRNVPAWIKQGYFQAGEHGAYAIAPELRRRVSFDYLNLATDPFPGHDSNSPVMDIILCRNVLMYFDPSHAQQVIDNLHRSLARGGWLAVSPAESGGQAFPHFERVQFPDATLYRKRNDGAVSAPGFSSASHAPVVAAPAPPDMAAEWDKPDAPSLATQARRCADNGSLEEADRLCKAAIAADKCDPTLRYLHALVLEGQGRLDAAAQALNHVLYLDANFVLAHFALGNLCRRRHKKEEADRHFANAFELLHRHAPGDMLAGSDGVSAGHLFEVLRVDGRTT